MAPKINGYANVVTAIATIAIAFFTYTLWRTSNRQWATAQDQLRISERPYVEIAKSDSGTVAEWTWDSTGHKNGIRMYFENAGNTPAKGFLVNGGFGLPPDTSKFVHLWPKIIQMRKLREAERSGLVIDMGAYDIIPAKGEDWHPMRNVGADVITSALKATIFYPHRYLFGDFEYTDIFGEYCCEEFCLQVNNDTGDLEPCQGVDFSWPTCPQPSENICSQ